MKNKIFLIIFFIPLFVACAVTNNQELRSGSNSVELQKSILTPETQESSLALYHYMLGQLALNEEDFEIALKNLAQASSLQTGPAPSLHGKLAELYLRKSDLNKALVEAELANKEDPKELHYILLLAGIKESGVALELLF